MITCEICKKQKSESDFSSIIFELGYPSICRDCERDFPEKTEQMQLDALEKQQQALDEQQKRESKKREAIRYQTYEGEFDWM